MSRDFDDMTDIRMVLEDIRTLMPSHRRSTDALDFGVFVVIVLLALILWRVW